MSDINFLDETSSASSTVAREPVAPAKLETASATDQGASRKTVTAQKSTREEIAETLEDLEALLKAGASEHHAVTAIASIYEGTSVGAAYGRIADKLIDGTSLSDAINDEESVFPRVARDLISAGVNQQILWRNLRRSAELIRKSSDLTAELRVKLANPISLAILTVIVIVASVNLAFGNPDTLGPSAAVVATLILNATRVVGAVAIVALVGGIIAMIWYNTAGKKNPKFRLRIDRYLLTAPKGKRGKRMRRELRKVTTHDAGAKFTEVLASSLDAGMDESQSLRTAARATGNAAIILHVEEHIQRTYDGTEDLAGVARSPYFPPTLSHRLALQPGASERIDVLRDLSATYGKKAENASTSLANRLARRVDDLTLMFGVTTVFLLLTPMMISLQDMGNALNHV